MSQYQAVPRLVHMEVLYKVFAYLKNHKDVEKLAYGLNTPEVDKSDFNNNTDWKDFNGDLEEELPPKMVEPCGNVVRISAFVNAYHAENVVFVNHIQVSSYSCRTPGLFCSQRGRTWLKHQHLGVILLCYVYVRS